MAVNRYVCVGNLTKDPQISATKSGMAILSFSIAVNNRRKNQQGEWENDPCFIDCTMFGNRAESVASKLCKGMKVSIDGKLRQEHWTTKDGQKRSKHSILVDDLDFISKPAQSDVVQQQQAFAESQESIYDSEIPF
jgi:single-strand DNA-binding protein